MQTLRGHGKLTVTLRTLERRAAQRPVRRRRAGRAARAHPAARHAPRRRRQRRRRGARRTATGTAPTCPRPTSAARPACSTASRWSAPARVADRLWARHAISVLGLDAPAVEGAGQHRHPAARAPRSPCASRRAPTPCARWTPSSAHLREHTPVGRAARDRGRARVDADRAAGARRPPSARWSRPTASPWRGWAAAARSRSSPSCATPTRTPRSCSGARRTPTSRRSTPPTSPSTSARSTQIALAEALLLQELAADRARSARQDVELGAARTRARPGAPVTARSDRWMPAARSAQRLTTMPSPGAKRVLVPTDRHRSRDASVAATSASVSRGDATGAPAAARRRPTVERDRDRRRRGRTRARRAAHLERRGRRRGEVAARRRAAAAGRARAARPGRRAARRRSATRSPYGSHGSPVLNARVASHCIGVRAGSRPTSRTRARRVRTRSARDRTSRMPISSP